MSLLLAASTSPPPPVNDPNATRPFGWVAIKSWDIPDQYDYQRKIRVTASGIVAVTDQPSKPLNRVELQAWFALDAVNYQARRAIVQDGSASQPPVRRLQRIEQSLWDVPNWPEQRRKVLVPIPVATVADQPFRRLVLDAHTPWFVLDGTNYQRRVIGLPTDGPAPVVPPTTVEGGYIWNRFKGDKKPKKREQVYRPLGDEFLRVQLEQMRLAGLIDENEEEELLILLIAMSAD